MDPARPTPTGQAPAVPSRARLATSVLGRTVVFSALLGPLVFLPAGTWHFWQAWAYAACYVLPVVAFLLWMIIVDPQAVERRLEGGEPTSKQRNLRRTSAPLFVLAVMAPGFDYRFGWTRNLLAPVPPWLSVAADFLALAAVLLVVRTIYVNRFAARTIRVEEGQKVITSGPYRIVRHPMYSGFILSQLAMPVGMASLVTIPLFVLLIPFYVVRLLDEEKLLIRDLPGYADYCRRTRWRLVPFVW